MKNIKEKRKNIILLPYQMILDISKLNDYDKPILIEDIKNAKNVCKLWNKHFDNLENININDIDFKKMKRLLLKIFNPLSVSRYWWKNYLNNVENCLIELSNPFETF